MECEICGQDNLPEARFCANCGARLVTEVEQPSPVAELGSPEAHFCTNCGARLVTKAEQPSPVAERGSPKLLSKWLLVGVIIAVLAITGISVRLALLSDGTETTTTTTPPPLPTTTAAPLVQVTFPDANLEAVIREAINRSEGPIYTSDLESLTVLEALAKGISDLTGLEYCVNLEELYLDNNIISEISALAGLTDLASLTLSNNNTSEISPLAGLTNLWWLDLSGNNISDISPLTGLTDLWELYLDNNIVSDISPLATLINLKWLYFSGNNINDIFPLVANNGLAAGDKVYLRDNPLSTTSINVYIPQLEARGVIVKY